MSESTGPRNGPEHNPAAERLLAKLLGRHHRDLMVTATTCVACNHFTPTAKDVRAALLHERRATVERIRVAIWPDGFYGGDSLNPFDVQRVLDATASEKEARHAD